jgi:hypothetical protein
MEEKRSGYRLLVRKPEGKRPLGRPKHKWVDNTSIKVDLGEVGWVVNAVMNLQIP